MLLLANAFSLNMLDGYSVVDFLPVAESRARAMLSQGFTSCIGHQATADFLSARWSMDIPCNRSEVTLPEQGTLGMIVVQVKERLPEGKVLSQQELSRVPVVFWWVRRVGGEE